MTTRNIAPRADGEGYIGTSEKRWLGGNYKSLDIQNGSFSPLNTLQRETAYSLGDVVHSNSVNEKYFLKCTTAGTTGAEEPDLSGATSNAVITDGTAQFTVQTKTSKEEMSASVAETYAPLASPAFTGNPTAPTQDSSDNSTKIATTAFVKEQLLSPTDITETPASSTSYTSSVPSGKVFANFNSIGGKTIAWNQLVDTGTSSVTLISGHKYYTLVSGSASIQTGAGSAISVTGGTDKVTDLTLAFGSGNEPSVADFQSMFPFYASEGYNAGTLLSAGVTEVQGQIGDNRLDMSRPVWYGNGYYDWAVGQKIRFNTPSVNINCNDGVFIFTITTTWKGLCFLASVDDFANTEYKVNIPITSANNRLRSLYYLVDGNYNILYGEAINSSIVKTVGGNNTYPTTKYIAFNIGTNGNGGDSFTVTKPYISKSSVTEYTPFSQATMPIPSAIQSLDGYGWSAGTVYNYVDFTNKKFVKRVGSRAYASGDDSDSTVITDGTTTYYALTTPIETDISDLLGADGIACESGGSLTFANSNGDNYRIPVPVNLDWIDGTDGLMTVQDKAKLDMIYEYIQRLGL